MKILIVSIYNETPAYKIMLDLQNKIVNNCKDIDFYFITFNNTQEEEFVIINNILYIKGVESYLSIMEKTIKAFKYLLSLSNYDFIIRTNISTIINYDNLITYLNSLPKTNIYTGGIIMKLNWMDRKFGINEITNEKYSLLGLHFVCGTSIILSNDVAQFILDNSHLIHYNIVDDVSFGLFIREYKPDIYSNLSGKKCGKIIYNLFDKDAVFIRNKILGSVEYKNREMDIENITTIINTLVK